MTAPNREQHQNLASTTLNGAINSSVTSITVTTGSVFPAVGNFRVMVDTEIMVCTARSSNTLTVIRGQDGTSAASQSDLATIRMIYDTQGLSRLFQDNDSLFGYSSRKPINGLFADDGHTILTSSDFTFTTNPGSATLTDQGQTILLSCPTDSARNIRCVERPAPSTPYSYIAAFRCNCAGEDSDAKPMFGMGFRESSSSKLMLISVMNETFFGSQQAVVMSRYNSATSLFTQNLGPHNLMVKAGGLVWLKIENDGTNTKYYIGHDGINWILYLSESKTAFFAGNPNSVLWFGANSLNSSTGALDLLVQLHHWSKGE